MDYTINNGGKLYRSKVDGQENEPAYGETFWDVKIVGDWIYYLSDFEHGMKIYKVKTDRSDKTLLVDTDFKKDKNGSITLNDNVACFDIADDMIYYSFITNKPDKQSKVELYSIKTDGTGKTKIADGVFDINIKDGWIYYINQEDQAKIYKMKLDGTEKTKVCDDSPNNFIIVGDWIYYTDGGINKVKVDGTGKQLLYNGEADFVSNADDDWIYFGIGANGFYKVRNGVNPKNAMPEFIKP